MKHPTPDIPDLSSEMSPIVWLLAIAGIEIVFLVLGAVWVMTR